MIKSEPSVELMPGRLLSLDFFRGLIMVLLALEGAGLWDSLYEATHSPLLLQFFHHPWNGLRFWDLIQPGFMFIAGVGLTLSVSRQLDAGVAWSTLSKKMLIRCGWLFFWGVICYAVRPQGLSFELWNVLTQLSFTLLVAFLIFRWTSAAQIIFSIGLLVVTEIVYRYTTIPNFDQPFIDQHNFGNFMDLVLMNKINHDGWVAINCVPTAAHTIWGMVAGRVILKNDAPSRKIKKIAFAGALALVVGYLMDLTITPIIKRISTSSFVLASGGWCLLMLAACYWWIDIREHRRYLFFFTVVGMNSIFIYLFFEIIGARWFNGFAATVTNGLIHLISIPDSISHVVTALIIFFIEWWLCLFLYRRKIFFRL